MVISTERIPDVTDEIAQKAFCLVHREENGLHQDRLCWISSAVRFPIADKAVSGFETQQIENCVGQHPTVFVRHSHSN